MANTADNECSSSPRDRMARARLSLEGLSVGDALGEQYLRTSHYRHYIRNRLLFEGPWAYTDDTSLAIGIVECLATHGWIDQNDLADRFALLYNANPHRGYGRGAAALLEAIAEGGNWRHLAAASFGGQGSLGNGSAMRVGPLGAFFADDPDAVVEQARLSAEVTHMHPEGQSGAIAVALAAAFAWRGRNAAPDRWAELLPMVIEYIPRGPTRCGLETAAALPDDTAVHEAARVLGNGDRITCQDTVPFCLWCVSQHMDSFNEALWHTLQAHGDMDTNCAIVGSIAILATGREAIPGRWLANREPLPPFP